jgi:dopamine beta-monooxygenase
MKSMMLLSLFLISFINSENNENIFRNNEQNYSMTIKIDKYVIPEKSTTYACKYAKVDELLQSQSLDSNKKYHAIKFSPLITNEMVHHMIIYSCIPGTPYTPDVVDCTKMNNFYCLEPIALSGSSTESVTLPQEAGYIWGSMKTKLVWLEIHYSNPSNSPGQIDSSGFQIDFTSNLRTHNMGTLILGTPESDLAIPANTPSTVFSNTCSSRCINKLPADGINIVYTLLHGHLLMNKMRMEIKFSNGTTDSTTFRSDKYNFHNQYIKIVDPPIKVLPGSTITTVCDYDSLGVNKPTKGGKESTDEMCYAFVAYYPGEIGFNMCYDDFCKYVPESILTESSSCLSLNLILVLILVLVLF